MTPTRYFAARIAQSFGFGRKNIRMGDAANEMHLLREAETHLGEAVWEKVEDIEELSIEYWNLRKLRKEYSRVSTDLETCQQQLAEAHEERAILLGATGEPFQDLLDERQKIIGDLETFARQRDEIVAKAREVRRIYDGIKTKHEVLTAEGLRSEEDLVKVSERLAELKKQFAGLKEERLAVAAKIEDGEARIDEIESLIDDRKKERRGKASEAFQIIGEVNQQMSTFRAELGLLDTQMRQLYAEIGRHVSRNGHNATCAAAAKGHRGLMDVMAALRKSIEYNHKLAETL